MADVIKNTEREDDYGREYDISNRADALIYLLKDFPYIELFEPIAKSMTRPVRHPPIDSRVLTVELHRRGGHL